MSASAKLNCLVVFPIDKIHNCLYSNTFFTRILELFFCKICLFEFAAS